MMINLFNRHLYGDYGENSTSGEGTRESLPATAGLPVAKLVLAVNSWPLWEVFIRSKQGLDHKHVGSLHAADAKMAINNARDVYTRRQEGISIWVVQSIYIHAADPSDATSLYDPAHDKIYRHPGFYDLPDEVKHM